jgi:hypothetical protein
MRYTLDYSQHLYIHDHWSIGKKVHYKKKEFINMDGIVFIMGNLVYHSSDDNNCLTLWGSWRRFTT